MEVGHEPERTMLDSLFVHAEIAERHRQAHAAELVRRARRAAKPAAQLAPEKPGSYYMPARGLSARDRAQLSAVTSRLGPTI